MITAQCNVLPVPKTTLQHTCRQMSVRSFSICHGRLYCHSTDGMNLVTTHLPGNLHETFYHITSSLKGMSDERQNRPTKICRVSCKNRPILSVTKMPNFVGQDRACSIFDDFVGGLFVYQTTNFVYVAMVIVYTEDEYLF